MEWLSHYDERCGGATFFRRNISRDTLQTVAGIVTRYRFHNRLGSRRRRKSHSKPALPIQAGARRSFPELKSNAAPTPSITGTRNLSLWSYIQRSCFGVLKPTHITSGAVACTRAATSFSSSFVRGRKGGV